jgi:hypothetical protein
MPAATAATTRLRRSREFGAAIRAGLHFSQHLESNFRFRCYRIPGRDGERALAEARGGTIDEATTAEMHARELAVAQHDARGEGGDCGATPGRDGTEGQGPLGAAQGGVAGGIVNAGRCLRAGEQ